MHEKGFLTFYDLTGEMALSLPLGGEPAFPRLFQQFEADRTAFGLASYSLSMSTLEEVFLRLAEDEKGGSSANLPAADDDKGMPRSRARSEGWDGDVAMEVQDAAGVGAGDDSRGSTTRGSMMQSTDVQIVPDELGFDRDSQWERGSGDAI